MCGIPEQMKQFDLLLKKIFNKLEIMVFSDHDSRIAQDELGSSIIFAQKKSDSNDTKIISKTTTSNAVFTKSYYRNK